MVQRHGVDSVREILEGWMGEVPEAIREKLAIVLDVDDLVVALRMARELRPWFGTAKVGLELYSSVGPDAVTALTISATTCSPT